MAPKKKDQQKLDDDKTEMLINLIQQNPPIYDKRDDQHKDVDKIRNIWESILVALEINDLTGMIWVLRIQITHLV